MRFHEIVLRSSLEIKMDRTSSACEKFPAPNDLITTPRNPEEKKALTVLAWMPGNKYKIPTSSDMHE